MPGTNDLGVDPEGHHDVFGLRRALWGVVEVAEVGEVAGVLATSDLVLPSVMTRVAIKSSGAGV